MCTGLRKYLLVFFVTGFFACSRQLGEQHLSKDTTYTVTLRKNQMDSTFTINAADGVKKKYFTALWVSDPECTECKDCYVDSGDLKMPGILKPYVEWNKDLLLTCHNPYEIERTAYARYKITGYVTGVKRGYPVFCVSAWQRLR